MLKQTETIPETHAAPVAARPRFVFEGVDLERRFRTLMASVDSANLPLVSAGVWKSGNLPKLNRKCNIAVHKFNQMVAKDDFGFNARAIRQGTDKFSESTLKSFSGSLDALERALTGAKMNTKESSKYTLKADAQERRAQIAREDRATHFTSHAKARTDTFVKDGVNQFARHDQLIADIAAADVHVQTDSRLTAAMVELWHTNAILQNKRVFGARHLNKYVAKLDAAEASFARAKADRIGQERRRATAESVVREQERLAQVAADHRADRAKLLAAAS